jgi:hypothetical protein
MDKTDSQFEGLKEWRMATNVQNTRTTNRPDDTTGVTPTGVGGVAVYDRDVDRTTDPALRPSATMTNDPVPVETRSSGSILSWIIGAIVLIVLVYFLLQMLF